MKSVSAAHLFKLHISAELSKTNKKNNTLLLLCCQMTVIYAVESSAVFVNLENLLRLQLVTRDVNTDLISIGQGNACMSC